MRLMMSELPATHLPLTMLSSLRPSPTFRCIPPDAHSSSHLFVDRGSRTSTFTHYAGTKSIGETRLITIPQLNRTWYTVDHSLRVGALPDNGGQPRFLVQICLLNPRVFQKFLLPLCAHNGARSIRATRCQWRGNFSNIRGLPFRCKVAQAHFRIWESNYFWFRYKISS